MVTNDLGACEWFVWDLRRSGLIDRGHLDQIVGEFLKRNPRAEAPALAEYLVAQGTLTGFQAERVLNGKTQGLVLGPYVLLDAIGQGSMGQVYKATSKNDNATYAVKVLPRRSMWNVRLARRQVRSFGSFAHPAVVPFMDVGTAGGLHYLVWPLAEGQTLEALLQQQGRLTPSQAALIGVQVAQGLAVCHQNSIFHGLVKPSNIMLGSDGQARVLDFGIGSLLAENDGESLVDTMSTANTLTSGLDCASPESIMEPTNRTPAGDQYSLGCTLYYSLTGRVPFPEGSAVEKMMAHQTQEPEPIKTFAPDVPDGLIAVVARLMSKTPEGRYGSTDEVVEALEPYLGELAGAAAAPTNTPARGRPGLGLGSKPRMNGLGAKVSSPITQTPGPSAGLPHTPVPGGGKFQPPGGSRLPPSGRPTTAPEAPTSRPAAPPTRSAPARAGGPSLPSRASFQLPQSEPEIELSPAMPGGLPLMDPAQHGHHGPAALRASAGWVADAAEQSERSESDNRNNGLGTVGVLAAAAILMVMVFIGAKLLMTGQP